MLGQTAKTSGVKMVKSCSTPVKGGGFMFEGQPISRNYSINESSYSLLYGTESFQNSFPTCRHFGFKSSRVPTMKLWMH